MTMPRPAATLLRHRSLAIGVVAQGLQYGSALVLLPVLVTRLSPADVGIWYVFMTAYGLAGIVDFGFQPTFARSIALAQAGVGEVGARGLDTVRSPVPNALLTARIAAAARSFYLGLALLLAAILLVAGVPYVAFLAQRGGLDTGSAVGAWIVFAAGIALGMYYQWIPPVLLGSDRADRNYQFQLVSRGLFVAAGVVALMAGGGLIGLAIVYTASQIVGRIAASRLLAGVLPPRDVPDRAATRRVLRAMWPNAWRMGLAVLGGFLIVRSNLFAISAFLGLAASASYAVSFQLLYAAFTVGQMPMQIALARIVAARVAGDRPLLRRLVMTNMAGFVGIFVAGAAAVILIAPPLLAAIGSHVRLMPPGPSLLLAAILLLEGHQWVMSFVITTGNRVPFAGATLAAGVVIAALAPIAAWRGYGIVGILACQGLVQLAYNNWRWPLMAYRELYGRREGALP